MRGVSRSLKHLTMTGQQLQTAAFHPFQAVVKQTTAQWLAKCEKCSQNWSSCLGPLTRSQGHIAKTIARNHPQASPRDWPPHHPLLQHTAATQVLGFKSKTQASQGLCLIGKMPTVHTTMQHFDSVIVTNWAGGNGQTRTHTKCLTRDTSTPYTLVGGCLHWLLANESARVQKLCAGMLHHFMQHCKTLAYPRLVTRFLLP